MRHCFVNEHHALLLAARVCGMVRAQHCFVNQHHALSMPGRVRTVARAALFC